MSKAPTLTVKAVIKKIEQLHPGLKDEKFTNPFLYKDITKWYNQLKSKYGKAIIEATAKRPLRSKR